MKLLLDGDKLYCKACNLTKESSLFHTDSSSKRGKSYYCKECANHKSRVWQQTNKDNGTYKKIQANSFYKRNYGISLEEREQLKLAQDNKCAICKVDFTELNKRIHTDHCHSTGKIRGLLCQHCNQGLGHFKDSFTLLENAINYLGKNK